MSHEKTTSLVRELGVDYDSRVLEWKEKAEVDKQRHERPGCSMEKESPKIAESSGGVRSCDWLGDSSEEQESQTKSGSSSSSDESGQETHSELSEESPSSQESRTSQQNGEASSSLTGMFYYYIYTF